MNRDKLAAMREVYEFAELIESNIDSNPHEQFKVWMKAAMENKLFEPNAMSLATVGKNGQPSCRTVLLKDIIDGSYVLYTNFDSKKGQQIEENDKVALLFWWREQERQVRIEGQIRKLSNEDSDVYYQKRPIGSRIGAMASPQSKVLKDRNEIEELYKETEGEFIDGKTTCPEYWGGYTVKPELFEFWQGRTNRLHDRIQYTLVEETWKIERLAP